MAQNNAVPEACDCTKKWVTIGLMQFECIEKHINLLKHFRISQTFSHFALTPLSYIKNYDYFFLW